MVVHEFAHALSALWFGDDTARVMGRLTLDPIVHVDPIMTVLVPLVTYFGSNGTWAFGGARPVPIDPRRLRNPAHDMMWIAAAGPLSNVLIAMVLVGCLNVIPTVDGFSESLARGLFEILGKLAIVNLFLAAFNLLPIPPLDGSKILAAFLPPRIALGYLGVGSHQGLFLVLLLSVAGGLRFLQAPVLSVFRSFVQWFVL